MNNFGLKIIGFQSLALNGLRLILRTENSNQMQIGNLLIKSILCEEFLGVKFDHKLAFD